MLAAQYDTYEPLPGLHIRGKQTLDENIADLAGLSAAYDGYRAAYGGKEAPTVDGLTGDQRFFMAYAQAWKAIQREDAVRAQMLSDPHSPHVVRGSNPERNIDAWYAAFGVKEGDKMYLPPDKRVHIW